jgi:hypothetical protein
VRFAYCWLRNLPLSKKKLGICLDKERRNKYYAFVKNIAIGRDFIVINYAKSKFLNYIHRIKGRYCSIGVVVVLRAVTISCRNKRLLSLSKSPDQLWSLWNLLFNGNMGEGKLMTELKCRELKLVI